MRHRPVLALIFLLGLAASPTRASDEAKPIVMATMLEQQNSFAGRWLRLIYTEAFQQLGVAVEIRSLPAARASAEAVAGNVDGELARGYDYGAMQTALMRVPEAPLSASSAAYTRNPDIHLSNGWESLRGTNYRVDFRFGYPVIQQRLAAVLPPGSFSGVLNAQLGLRKLVVGRSDLYVDTAEVVDPMLASPEFAHAGIRQAGVLEHMPIYAYLNKRHEKLALRLSAVIRKMRESGQIEQLRQQALKD
ncbi:MULTISPECIES: hypothetical protein [unclassified Duganella]|uniref:hypothetical protein n=1 Tax=unclassified Duganella TaxID=2636909 RepID=UPI0011C126C9|nr:MULTISPECIES: hypothetical protein [unclassified Duganella]